MHKNGSLNLAFFWIILFLQIGCGEGTGTIESDAIRDFKKEPISSAEIKKSFNTDRSISVQKLENPKTSGFLSVKIARSGSVLPTATIRVHVTFNEISVYKQNYGWLNLTTKSHPVDIFPLNPGATASLIEAVKLPAGKYSRIRFGINEANILFRLINNPIQIPNSSLKTTKYIEFELGNGNQINLIGVFNLRNSIHQLGGTFKLYPEFNVVDERQTASIHGTLQAGTFNSGGADQNEVEVMVYGVENRGRASSDHEIARLTVRRGRTSAPLDIGWLPSGKDYTVVAKEQGREIHQEVVTGDRFLPRTSYELNGGVPF